jgi:uncharacterized protein (DUF1778 family)
MGSALKPARIEIWTTDEIKNLIFRAAALSGVDATAFVLAPAIERARQVIASNSVIELTLDGQRRFAKLIENPPKPTEAMKALGELPDFEERSDA